MILYCGIDLHSNNCVIDVINENYQSVFRKKVSNDLESVLQVLKPFKSQLNGIAVESTYNWYWLVDGLMDDEYAVYLVNTAAVKQYEGLKHTDDQDDAYHLAHLLGLNILPTGYVYPKAERPLRDLLRRRSYLVRQRTSNLNSLQCFYSRHTGKRLVGEQAKKLTSEQIQHSFSDSNTVLDASTLVAMNELLDQQIAKIEKKILPQAKLKPEFEHLKTVDGIGNILALTIQLETGDIKRFAKVGNYSSYCRCVSSSRNSNGKKKGVGNVKNGNKYLSWAFAEAAHYAIRFNEKAQKFYQRKMAKRSQPLAFKALANKLSKACYYIMRENIPFNEEMLFG